MRKEEADGDENQWRVTKQLCSDQMTGIGPTYSVKNIEWWQVSDGAKRGVVF